MELREKARDIFAWGRAQRTDELALTWENHSKGAASVAERLAEKAGMDKDLAFAMGLLHDIGRYRSVKTGMNHIIYGYELLMEKDLPEVARICLTHSFNPKEKVQILKLDDPEKTEFVKQFVMSAEYDDYDKLIQLADFMSGSHGITTIERRFCSVLSRHDLPEPQMVLRKLYELKEYFDKKCGVENIYSLFKIELEEAAIRGIPGDYREYKKKEER
ncbi:HD domain-containing protein [Candidatus Saccharibacteria bacterium]|nr:HD domain-containing protein [Candidatus Saccharibacteria bacterium]